jgi:hypothetical protein
VLLLISKESPELPAEVEFFELLAAEEIGGYPSLQGIIILAQALKAGVVLLRFLLPPPLLKLHHLAIIQHLHHHLHLSISSDQYKIILPFLMRRNMVERPHQMASVAFVLAEAFPCPLHVEEFEFMENFVLGIGKLDELEFMAEGQAIPT